MSWFPHVTVAAIIEVDGHFLMVEEFDADGNPVLNQPAGHLEENETLLDAVAREALEETGWSFQAETLVGIYQWKIPPNGATYIRFCFRGSSQSSLPQQPLDSDIIRTVWMTRQELETNKHRLRSPLVLTCIEDHLAGQYAPLDLLHDISST